MLSKSSVLWIVALATLLAFAPLYGFALDERPGRTERDHAARTKGVDPRGLRLVQAVLDAGDVSAARSQQAEFQFRAFARQLHESEQVFGAERRRAQTIHRFVHERILEGKYETSGSDLANVLAGGPFNCATASVLFLALAADYNLEGHAVAVPGHVWCRVASRRGSFDVETTCRHWFELTSREPAAVTAELTQFMVEHDRRSTSARVLDQHALIAVFHYNRGVRLLKEQQFSAAAAANLKALKLDPRCAPAYDNLLATINNWSLAIAVRGERELGLELLEAGLTLAGDYESFRCNYRYLSQQQGACGDPLAIGERGPKRSSKHVFSTGGIESNAGF
ncbi:MAG: hypothetical protein HY288_02130 [Planctomycetia bacterium]|nr:hypothetical protein [Planctomycetia bacterium]